MFSFIKESWQVLTGKRKSGTRDEEGRLNFRDQNGTRGSSWSELNGKAFCNSELNPTPSKKLRVKESMGEEKSGRAAHSQLPSVSARKANISPSYGPSYKYENQNVHPANHPTYRAGVSTLSNIGRSMNNGRTLSNPNILRESGLDNRNLTTSTLVKSSVALSGIPTFRNNNTIIKKSDFIGPDVPLLRDYEFKSILERRREQDTLHKSLSGCSSVNMSSIRPLHPVVPNTAPYVFSKPTKPNPFERPICQFNFPAQPALTTSFLDSTWSQNLRSRISGTHQQQTKLPLTNGLTKDPFERPHRPTPPLSEGSDDDDSDSVEIIETKPRSPFFANLEKARQQYHAKSPEQVSCNGVELTPRRVPSTPQGAKPINNSLIDSILRPLVISPERQSNILSRMKQCVLSIAKPDTDFTELRREEEEEVQRAFRGAPANQVLADAFRYTISRSDICTLDKLNWLNDNVMNFYMELIMDRCKRDESLPRTYAFNTFFYPKVRDQGHTSVRRWTKSVDIFSYDLLLVPVHLGNHWCLAVVDLAKKAIHYYDSLGGMNYGCMETLKKYLEAEALDKKKDLVLDWEDWQFNFADDIPRQKNGSDCGVFTCKFADFLSRRKDLDFSQEHMQYFRKRMCLEILQKKLMGS